MRIQYAGSCRFHQVTKTIVFLIFTLSVSFSRSFGQLTFYPEKPVDSAKAGPLRESFVRKHPGRAKLEFGIGVVTPFLFDRYVRNTDYAQISFQTIGENLKPAHWSFDNDEFGTNQFAHPYHGSIYFSSFRTNGYSFWQSVPAAMAGSYLWETFAENQYPSINDFINTSFGGIVLGEMTFRLANKLVNNRRTGFRRQAEEVLGFLVSPTNGLNRIIDRKWGKVSRNTIEQDSSKIIGEFGIGQRKYNSSRLTAPGYGWYGRIKLLYGTPFENYRKPFSNISINAEFGKDDSSAVNAVNVYGSLAGWEIRSDKKVQSYAILSANYDYIRNEAFFYGAQSVKINVITNFGLLRKMKFNTALGFGTVLLAGVPDVYSYKGRNYDYGSGINYNATGGFTLVDKLFFGINYRGSYIRTWDGNTSHYFLHSFTSEVKYQPFKHWAAAVEPGYFTLRGYYGPNAPEVIRTYPYIRVTALYNFNLN